MKAERIQDVDFVSGLLQAFNLQIENGFDVGWMYRENAKQILDWIRHVVRDLERLAASQDLPQRWYSAD